MSALQVRKARVDPLLRYLMEDDAEIPWCNLGFWKAGVSYRDAARDLARLVGAAAALGPGQRILDIACGYGASLRLWKQESGVDHVDAIEASPRCRRFIAERAVENVRVLPYASIEAYWQADEPSCYDAIVCVDAAYHFTGSAHFLKGAKAALVPGGRLAFTTLLLGNGWSSLSLMKRLGIRLLANLAAIPRASLISESAWRSEFESLAYEPSEFRRLDREVLLGFAEFVERRQIALGPLCFLSPSWLKIWVTGLWARALCKGQELSYVLIVTKRSAQEP